jgi:hypothetical protein
MPIAYTSALDEMFGMIKSSWDANAAATVGYIPEIRWPGVAKSDIPDCLKFWARVSTKIVVDGQSSLSDGNGSGNKRYTAIGLLFIQIFAPRSVGGALVKARELAMMIRERFRSSSPSDSIWFRDQKIDELPSTDDHYPLNVVVTFEYDQISPGIAPTILHPGFPLSLEGLTKHLPVEPLDGLQVDFTFVGLPADGSYALVFNGIIQGSFIRNGDIITVEIAPGPTEELYALW